MENRTVHIVGIGKHNLSFSFPLVSFTRALKSLKYIQLKSSD